MISVIIPTFNKASHLDLTLASFTLQTDQAYEIVIVDDGSTDHTREVVKKYQPLLPLTYLYQENQGRAKARNTGLAQATGEFVLFNDDDVILAPDFLAELLKTLTSGNPNKVVIPWRRAVLSIWEPGCPDYRELFYFLHGKTEIANKVKKGERFQLTSTQALQASFETEIKNILMGDAWFDPIDHFDQLNRFCWVYAITAALAVPFQSLQTVGLFDEHYTGWGVEDNDLCYRLFQNGADFILEKQAVAYQQIHPMSSTREDRKREYAANLEYFCRKYNTLEAFLFWRLIKGKLNLLAANHFANKIRAIDDPAVTNVIMNTYRELLTVTMKQNYQQAA